VRISFSLSEHMVLPMIRDPGYRTAFECERSTCREEVFDELRRFEPAMSEKAMVADTDPKASRKPPEEDGNQECSPGEVEEGNDCTNVKSRHQ
jgi:hypothetical protein